MAGDEPTVPMKVVNLERAFASFDERWSPRILAQMNEVQVKAAKLDGDFVWHRHDDTDELFLVTRGRLTIRFRDRDVVLGPGELLVVPKGVEHQPVADGPVEVLLIEPAGTVNTGDAGGDGSTAGTWI